MAQRLDHPSRHAGPAGGGRIALFAIALVAVTGVTNDKAAGAINDALSSFSNSLIWLIGVDAFLHIQTWFQWPRLFDLAHFVVLNRPGYAVSQVLAPALAEVWQGRLTRDAGST